MAYITHIHVENCRNVKQLDIDLSVPAVENGNGSAPAFRHLILTGPNGSGKSGVLQAIAERLSLLFLRHDDRIKLGLATFVGQRLPRNGTEPTHPDATEGTLTEEEASWQWSHDGAAKIKWGTRSNPEQNFVENELIAVYVSARRLLRRQKVPGPAALGIKGADLRPANDLASRFLQLLVNKHTEKAYALAEKDTAAADHITEWFDTLYSHIRSILEDSGLDIRYDRHRFNFLFKKSNGYEFDLSTLADGHASALALLAEILIRIDAVQQARNDFSFEPRGVVVVDEIEAHLHLSLQEQILPLLTDMFPRLQFIVATHSPAVIASIPNAVVYDLAKQKQKQILSDHLRGVRYGTLMTEHFGISSEIDLDSTEKLLRLRELVGRHSRTDDDDRELADLSALLSARSPALAVEVWMAKERLGAPRNGVTTGDRS